MCYVDYRNNSAVKVQLLIKFEFGNVRDFQGQQSKTYCPYTRPHRVKRANTNMYVFVCINCRRINR